MSEGTVERLDFSKPAPGTEISKPPAHRRSAAPGPATIAATWAHRKERHDPPGLRTRPWGFGGWVFCCGLIVDPQPGPRTVMLNDDGQPYASEAAARAAAWGWYERRLALLTQLEVAEAVMRTFIADDFWPVILTWSDDQVAEVERWLVNPTAEMPEVLDV